MQSLVSDDETQLTTNVLLTRIGVLDPTAGPNLVFFALIVMHQEGYVQLACFGLTPTPLTLFKLPADSRFAVLFNCCCARTRSGRWVVLDRTRTKLSTLFSSKQTPPLNEYKGRPREFYFDNNKQHHSTLHCIAVGTTRPINSGEIAKGPPTR